jgi:hypothetical protein
MNLKLIFLLLDITIVMRDLILVGGGEFQTDWRSGEEAEGTIYITANSGGSGSYSNAGPGNGFAVAARAVAFPVIEVAGGELRLKKLVRLSGTSVNDSFIVKKERKEVEGKALDEERKFTLVYPNPMNPECYIPVNAKCKMQNVKCRIYNILGQLVREIECSGVNVQDSRVYWDGKDSRGLEVPAGVYFYEVAGQGVRKMIALR